LTSLGTLAAGIAHEINSPLQVITGLSESLVDNMEIHKLEKDFIKQRLTTINRNAWRIAEIVKSLLTYARTSSEAMENHDLNTIIRSTTVLMEHQLKTWSNIVIEMELAPDLPSIICNQGQIGQVLINLLTNARDAITGGGKIIIRTGFADNDEHIKKPLDRPNQIYLQVADSGKGIPDEIRTKIFDPFFTTKPLGMATGLGLSILSGIVRSHGGEITVDSQVHKGTIFTVFFPIQQRKSE
jgi:two-component system, NtrC family, sensor kinase